MCATLHFEFRKKKKKIVHSFYFIHFENNNERIVELFLK